MRVYSIYGFTNAYYVYVCNYSVNVDAYLYNGRYTVCN